MLKRQRASSPPPTFHYDEEPATAPSSDAPVIPNVKKRRTAAPLLSAEHRGWARSSSESEIAQDDDDSDEDAEVYSRYSPPHPGAATYQTEGTNYIVTNSLLHDLHLRHLRRVEYDSCESSTSSHATLAKPPQPPTPPHCPYSAEDAFGKHVPMIHRSVNNSTPVSVRGVDDRAVAMHRYENVNKLLGSLVLHRRRETHVTVEDDPSATRTHETMMDN